MFDSGRRIETPAPNPNSLCGTGLQAIEDLADRLRGSGRTLLMCGARDQPAAVMRQAQFHKHIGEQNLCANIEAALARAAELHADQAA